MFCPKCGSQAEDGAAFCEKCGTPMPRQAQQHQAPQQPAQPQSAPQQQTPQQPAQAQPAPQAPPEPATYQQPQPAPQQPVPPQPDPAPKKKRWPIVVAACVVAAAAIAAAVVFVVLPRVAPKGIWVATKSVTTVKDSDGSATYTSTHTLDEKGNLTTYQYEAKWNDDSKTTSTTTYSYDDQGFYESDSYHYNYEPTSSDESADSYESSGTGKWTIGDDGMPTQLVRTVTDDDDTGTYTYSYEYGSDGHPSKRTTTCKSADYESESVDEFDSRGLYTKQTFKDEDSATETVWEYEYDSSDRPTKCTSTTTDTATGKTTWESVHTLEYDENGNVSTEKAEYTSYPTDGSDPQKSTTTVEYEYTYVEDPSPWVAELVRCSHQSFSGPF